MNKELKFGNEIRNELKAGIDMLSNAVATTLGPAGRNVIIEKEYGAPVSTKDGVTVAKEIHVESKFQNIGIQILKEAASQTNDAAGDGTTTSTVLAHAIISEGMRRIELGANPIELKRGIEKAVKFIVSELKNTCQQISNSDDIKNVAMISANNDEEIGKIITAAMDKVGKEGVITVEESKSAESSLEIVEGVQFARGYLSPYFINNNELMQVQLEEPYILLYDKKISDIKELVKLLEQVIAKNKPLLIIADDVDGQALATLIVNKIRGSILCCAVKAPDYGQRKTQMLEDIAILTGGKVLSPEKGDKLDKIQLEDLGTCRTVTVDNKNTTIIDGAGDPEKIKDRVLELKKLVDNATSDYDKEKYQERIGKLAGGVAILHIGADSEIEMKEKKDRVDDALHATRAAVEEGIIPGGGIVLYQLSKKYQNTEPKEYIQNIHNDDQREGIITVMKAIQVPFMKILDNAGFNADVIWKDLSLVEGNQNIGYDVRNEKIVDMYENGIVDPVKVTRVALEKAASVAGVFLTTECAIALSPDKDKNNQPMYNPEY